MPALIHGADRIRQNPAGRRRTSPEGGNRGMLPGGPGNPNGYGDLILRSGLVALTIPTNRTAMLRRCAISTRIRSVFRSHLRQETMQFPQSAKPSPIGAG
jgi:hypothetical protein